MIFVVGCLLRVARWLLSVVCWSFVSAVCFLRLLVACCGAAFCVLFSMPSVFNGSLFVVVVHCV